MKFSKKDWIFLVVGLVVLFLIWWFFFRNKNSESGYGTGAIGSTCWSNRQCEKGLGCRGGECQPNRRYIAPVTEPYVAPAPIIREVVPTPLTQPGVTSGITGANLFSNAPMSNSKIM